MNEKSVIIKENLTTKGWDVEFTGMIDRRDMNRIERSLRVQYAILQRNRSIRHILNTNHVKEKEKSNASPS